MFSHGGKVRAGFVGDPLSISFVHFLAQLGLERLGLEELHAESLVEVLWDVKDSPRRIVMGELVPNPELHVALTILAPDVVKAHQRYQEEEKDEQAK